MPDWHFSSPALKLSDKRSVGTQRLLLIAVVVLIGGNCLLGTGLCLHVRLGLGTERYFVLRKRRLLWRWIWAWRLLHRCFILSHRRTVNWIDHRYLPFVTAIGWLGRNFRT